MKHFLRYLLVTLMLTSTAIQADNPQMSLPDMDPIELLNSIDPADLEEMLRVLEELPPEALEELRKEGERYFESFGYDVEAMKKGEQPVTPKPTTPESTPQKPNKPNQERPIDGSSKEKYAITSLINQLINALSSIRTKATSDEVLKGIIAPLTQELDLLNAYLNRFDYERHLKHLEEKEFAPLKTKLQRLMYSLLDLDDQFVLPDYSRKRQSGESRRQQQKRAEATLAQFNNTMNNMFKTDTLLSDIEALFKKYDQEALTIKKKAEEQEKKALESSRRTAGTVTNINDQPKMPNYGGPRQQQQKGFGGSGTGAHAGQQGAQQQYRPTPPPAPNLPGSGGQQKQQPGKPGEKAKGKDGKEAGKPGEEKDEKGRSEGDKSEKVEPTPTEKLHHLKTSYSDIERLVGQHSHQLTNFAAALRPKVPLIGTVPAEVVIDDATADTINELIYSLGTVNKELDKFITSVREGDRKNHTQNYQFIKKGLEDHIKNLSNLQKLKDEFDKTLQYQKDPVNRGCLANDDDGATEALKAIAQLSKSIGAISEKIHARFITVK